MVAVLIALDLALATGTLALGGLQEAPASSRPSALVHARPGPAAVPEPDLRTAEVRALLDRRARAVLTRDRQAFLSTVDPRAGEFLARQAELFDALAGVPLSAWSYDLDPGRSQPARPDLVRRWGQWWAPEVSVRYALEGYEQAPGQAYDSRPALVAQGLTFARHDGRWRIAADDELPDRPTAREIWDEGPVRVSRGARCLVLSHPDPGPLVRQVAAACEAAVPRVTAVWGARWAQRVVVVVPSSVVELGRLVPQVDDLSQIAAVATAALASPATGYHPVGDRVLVNPAGFARLGEVGRRVVMTHEVTHVATRALTGPAVPTWLVEGLADYVGYLGTDLSVAVAAQELRADVRAGRLPQPTADRGGLRLEQRGTWPRATSRAGSPYACSSAATASGRCSGCTAAAGSAPAGTDLTGPFGGDSGSTPTALTAAWRADLQQRLR